jgi:pentatricopeptide repeat protein
VGNVSASTDEPSFRHHFTSKKEKWTVVRATIAIKTRKNKAPENLGYGFVELGSPEEALKCMKKMQGRDLGGQALTLSVSENKSKYASA